MTPPQAVQIILERIEAGRYYRFAHFDERLDERGLFWTDVQAVVNDPDRVRADGQDDYGRDRWLIRDRTTDGLRIELVIVLDQDELGHWTLLITLYHVD